MRCQGMVYLLHDGRIRHGEENPSQKPEDFLLWCEATAGSVEIADIVVNSQRRVGIGRQLVGSLLKSLPPETVVWAATRTTNEIAQRFYESLRFEVAGVLRRMHGTEEGADCVVYLRRAGGPI